MSAELPPSLAAALRPALPELSDAIIAAIGEEVPAYAHPLEGPFGRALRVANALRFGTVWINDHIPLASEMPHGGFKQSGYGKDLSAYSIEDYTVVKHVMASLS